MKEIRRTTNTELPQVLIHLADGYGQGYIYCYDLKEEQEGGYSYIETVFSHRPTASECIEALIRKHLSQNEEFDLINSFNRAQLGLIDGVEKEKAERDYREYLALLDTIKDNVRMDFSQIKDE